MGTSGWILAAPLCCSSSLLWPSPGKINSSTSDKPREGLHWFQILLHFLCPFLSAALRHTESIKKKKSQTSINNPREREKCRVDISGPRGEGGGGGRAGDELGSSCCLTDRYHCSLKHTHLPQRGLLLFFSSFPWHSRLEGGAWKSSSRKFSCLILQLWGRGEAEQSRGKITWSLQPRRGATANPKCTQKNPKQTKKYPKQTKKT